MAGTLDKPPTPEAAPPTPPVVEEQPPVVVPDDASRLCVNCAALLAEGQDWCLECGTAQPGRLGGRPGWRAALTIVAITALLAAGAVAAAYAALSSDAERRASAPAPPPAQPVVPPPPEPATPAPVEETAPEVTAPESSGADRGPKPSKPADEPDSVDPPSSGSSAPSAPSSGYTAPAPSGDTGSDTGDDPEPEPKPEPKTIALSPDAASTYDPFDRAGGLTGDPADAIDGRRGTAWEAPVGPDGFVNIGLLVSLEKAQEFAKVRLRAATPGFTVELYGAKKGTAPEGDPAAETSGWQKLDDTRDFGTDERLSMGEGKWRHVLLWFTEQPADTKVMIPELELRR